MVPDEVWATTRSGDRRTQAEKGSIEGWEIPHQGVSVRTEGPALDLHDLIQAYQEEEDGEGAISSVLLPPSSDLGPPTSGQWRGSHRTHQARDGRPAFQCAAPAKVFCEQPDDLSPEKLHRHRILAGTLMVGLGRMEESTRPRSRGKRVLPNGAVPQEPCYHASVIQGFLDNLAEALYRRDFSNRHGKLPSRVRRRANPRSRTRIHF